VKQDDFQGSEVTIIMCDYKQNGITVKEMAVCYFTAVLYCKEWEILYFYSAIYSVYIKTV